MSFSVVLFPHIYSLTQQAQSPAYLRRQSFAVMMRAVSPMPDLTINILTCRCRKKGITKCDTPFYYKSLGHFLLPTVIWSSNIFTCVFTYANTDRVSASTGPLCKRQLLRFVAHAIVHLIRLIRMHLHARNHSHQDDMILLPFAVCHILILVSSQFCCILYVFDCHTINFSICKDTNFIL